MIGNIILIAAGVAVVIVAMVVITTYAAKRSVARMQPKIDACADRVAAAVARATAADERE